MDCTEKTDTGTRRQPFPLSLIFHQKKDRTSCLPNPNEPTCQEKAHYPVFNPRDPRHNPDASIFPWRRQEPSSSSSESHRPINWVSSISKRSFHRARSGLLALRAGILHRSTVGNEFGMTSDSPSFMSPADLRRERKGRYRSSGNYTSTTQEDLHFGIEMYRMGAPPPSPINDTHTLSTFSLTNNNRVPNKPGSPSRLSAIISASEMENSIDHASTQDHILSQLSQGAEPATEITTLNQHSDSHVAPTTSESTDRNLMESPMGNPTSTALQDVDFADPQSVWAEPSGGHIQKSAPLTSSPGVRSLHSSESGHNRHSEQGQQRESQRRNSSALPQTISRSHRSHNITNTTDDEISETSAEVSFAFPGIYQEVMEQWARERRERQDGTTRAPRVKEQPDCIVLREASNSDPPSYHEAVESYGYGGHIIGTNHSEISDNQHLAAHDMLDTDEEQPLIRSTSADAEIYDVHFDEKSSHSEVSVADESKSEVEHLSDIGMPPLSHIEQPDMQPNLRDYGTFSFTRQAATLPVRTSFEYSERGTVEYLCNNHQNPFYSPDDSTSPGIISPEIPSTERTSVTPRSTIIWSPVESDILFPIPVTEQNEYFFADGKTSGQYPDQGNQPVKMTPHISDDGHMNNQSPYPIVDQRTQGLNNLISPGMLSREIPSNSIDQAVMSFEDDFTDDEFYPGVGAPQGQFQ